MPNISERDPILFLSSCGGRRGLNMSGLRSIRCRRIEMAWISAEGKAPEAAKESGCWI